MIRTLQLRHGYDERKTSPLNAGDTVRILDTYRDHKGYLDLVKVDGDISCKSCGLRMYIKSTLECPRIGDPQNSLILKCIPAYTGCAFIPTEVLEEL
jgi:hypothetical protein